MGERRVEIITISLAARRCGLAPTTVRRYVQWGLVETPLTEEDLVTLRRIRRLTVLGINLAGVEVILRMRRRIEELQEEVARLRAALIANDANGPNFTNTSR